MIGKRILSYEIKELIGQGGMGNVYLAVHVTSGERVAIKCLLPELIKYSHIRERFKNEANTMSLLPHPNIVKLLGYKDDDEGSYIIMEYIEGKELDKYIKTETGPMPSDKATDVMKGILSAVSFAHENGVIHRDIKPSNIFVTNDGHVKITDFGIAKVLTEADKKLTKTGIQMGTVYYMSPEQVKGKPVDKRSDIYALGVTFFQMVTGSNPYESMTTEYEVYSSIVNEPLPSITSVYPGAHPQFDAVISKATEKDPEQRFADCSEFSTVLTKATSEEAKQEGPIVKKKETTQVKKTVPPPRTSYAWVFGLIVLVALAIVAGWQYKLHDQYKSLISRAGTNYNTGYYQDALDLYNEAAQKKQYLVWGDNNENIPALKDDCYFRINKKEGDDLLMVDSFSLATSPDYKFMAIESFKRAKTFRNYDPDNESKITLCEKIQEAITYKKDGEIANAARSYRQAVTLAKRAGVDQVVIDHLNAAKLSVSQDVSFQYIWIDYDQVQDYRKGMLIHFKFQVDYLQYKPCSLVVWFYTGDGAPDKAQSTSYTTTDGQASVSGTLTPGYEKTLYSDYTLFMPYAEIGSQTGDHKFNAAVFYNNMQVGKTSEFKMFHFVEPATE
jgi:serine/threonine protein kinase